MRALLDDLAGDFCENRCILRASRALPLRGAADIRENARRMVYPPGVWDGSIEDECFHQRGVGLGVE